MKRIFLDANILFTAAHNSNGKAAFIIELGGQGYWELFTSAYAREEARRNLEIKYPDRLKTLFQLLQSMTIVHPGSESRYPQGLTLKDQPIFQAALACRATHLLTGDIKDFGSFMNKPAATYGVNVQTVADFLAVIVNPDVA